MRVAVARARRRCMTGSPCVTRVRVLQREHVSSAGSAVETTPTCRQRGLEQRIAISMTNGLRLLRPTAKPNVGVDPPSRFAYGWRAGATAMHRVFEYEKHAQACRDLAAKTYNQSQKQKLTEMAEAWARLAEERRMQLTERPV
jgi:hypothetical protein